MPLEIIWVSYCSTSDQLKQRPCLPSSPDPVSAVLSEGQVWGCCLCSWVDEERDEQQRLLFAAFRTKANQHSHKSLKLLYSLILHIVSCKLILIVWFIFICQKQCQNIFCLPWVGAMNPQLERSLSFVWLNDLIWWCLFHNHCPPENIGCYLHLVIILFK